MMDVSTLSKEAPKNKKITNKFIESDHLGLEVLKKRFFLYEKRFLCEKKRFVGGVTSPVGSNLRANSVASHRVSFRGGVYSFSLRLHRSL